MKQFLFLIIFITNLTSIFSQDIDFFTPETRIGGYGELHYNYEKPEEGESTEILDFHRFVLFFSHSFTEKWSFKSEVEIEHNYVNEGQGEVSLEQAYIDYHYADELGLQAGVLLVSAGLINEYHEPTLFLSVERPDYHKNIIPTTWFGNGAAVYGKISNFEYKFNVMEGLISDKFSASSGIRSGRQKGYKSNAENLLYNLRVDFVNSKGIRAGGSFTYNDATGDSSTNAINLIEFHLKYNYKGLYTVAEYGMIGYDNGPVENSRGYYFDLGYNVGKFFDLNSEIIPWFRYTNYNTASKVRDNAFDEELYNVNKWLVGLAFKPNSNIIFKFDYGKMERTFSEKETDVMNIGMGYMF